MSSNRAGRGSANVNAADRPVLAQDDCTAGRVAGVGVVADADAMDRCYSEVFHKASPVVVQKVSATRGTACGSNQRNAFCRALNGFCRPHIFILQGVPEDLAAIYERLDMPVYANAGNHGPCLSPCEFC